jgi:nickel/cobalt transporter (NicO) family protein
MFQLLLGSILLSLVHATIPNHWLPVVALGKAEKWSEKETLMVTAISGFAHTLSTVLVGITIGIIGIGLSASYAVVAEKIAPSLLITLGIIYLLMDLRKHHKHNHQHEVQAVKDKSKWAIIASLALAMFLSPCLEIEAYYFQAAAMGWMGLLMVSVVYVILTVSGMLILVFLANKGVQAIQSHFLDHHEKLISGLVLLLLGIFALLVHF